MNAIANLPEHVAATENSVREVATQIAREESFRINPDLFHQYLFCRLAVARTVNQTPEPRCDRRPSVTGSWNTTGTSTPNTTLSPKNTDTSSS